MKEIIIEDSAPAPVGPYNQAVLANGVLYVSGQIAIDQPNGTMILDDIESETHQVMKNLKMILAKAGMTFENVVKCSVFVSSMEDYGKVNDVYSQYFNDDTAPARELVEVANLPKYVNVEISCIAVQ